MKCNIKSKISIRRPHRYKAALTSERNGGNYKFDQVDGYLYKKDGLFALCRLEEWLNAEWWLIHRPSEKAFACFITKKEGELFLEAFLDEIDESNILYLTARYDYVREDFDNAYDKVYPSIWSEYRAKERNKAGR